MTDLSVDARLLESTRGAIPPINPAVVTFASALLVAGALALGNAYSWRQGALFLLGGGLGVVLYHALFGFTSAWRVFIANARGAGLRAQMLMLAVAMLLFFPAIGAGTLFGEAVRGEYGAVGVSVVVGAFLFGLGMQLGGGCASGTLYTAGGGNTRMLVTLFFFIAGSVLGAWHLPWWSAQPNVGAISLVSAWGVVPALILGLVVCALIAAALSLSRGDGMGLFFPASKRIDTAGGVSCTGLGRSLPAPSHWRLETSPRFISPAGRGA
jgi:uncharacterized protein